MLNRRSLLFGAGLGAFSRLAKARASNGVIAGAIRWDAWYSRGDSSVVSAQNSLSPQQWQFRAPWFCKVQNADRVSCLGSQADMDLEIQCAATAGLKYWAFDQYSAKSAPVFLVGWNLYQASNLKNQINWCWMAFADEGYFGSTGNFSTQVAQFVRWFSQPNYQKVLTDRPLLYLNFTAPPKAFGGGAEGVSNFRAMLSALALACTSTGLGAPYIVISGPVPDNHNFAVQILADAISAYAGIVTTPGLASTYAQLIAGTEGFWAQMARTGSNIVPCCLTGWDTRPRKQTPPSWGLSTYTPAFRALPNHFEPATPAEIAGHIQDAVNYIGAHPSKVPSKAILIYSQTECDEGGGCLIPTIGDPPQAGNTTNVLSAIGAVLN